MIYYIIAFLIFILHNIFSDKKVYCIVIAALLTLFAGLRANIIGPDTPQYEYIFNDIAKFGVSDMGFFFMNKSQSAEPGYILMNAILTSFVNYNVFKFLCAIIQVCPAIWIIYKYSKKPWVSCFIFFCIPVYTMMGMSMMRQGIAFGIFLLAFPYIIERNLKKYFFILALALTFHSSVIFMAPLYFIYNIPYKRAYNWIIAVLIIAFYALGRVMLVFVASFSRMQYEPGETSGYKMLIFFLLLLILSLFVKEKYLRHPFLKFQFYLLVYTVFCWCIGMHVAAVLRLAAYTEFFVCIYVTNVLRRISFRNLQRITLWGICIGCLLVMQNVVMRDMKETNYDYYPYYFLWEK